MLAAARFQYAGPPPELVRLLRGWFDTWPGIGGLAVMVETYLTPC